MNEAVSMDKVVANVKEFGFANVDELRVSVAKELRELRSGTRKKSDPGVLQRVFKGRGPSEESLNRLYRAVRLAEAAAAADMRIYVDQEWTEDYRSDLGGIVPKVPDYYDPEDET